MDLGRVVELTLTGMGSVALTLAIVLASQPRGLPTGIVTLDATEAVLSFIRAGGKEMPDTDYEAAAKIYQADLEAAIADFAAEHSVIVVNSATVLAGAPDITHEVSQKALARWREAKGTP
ncbi:TrbI F-type domain-containing protein (plasmid) [Cereibacter azotoformans]|uniref:TrbI F-type domain-containing protein n=1 Tax=Cereibacter azotoformans TaxID=43057 RepID=UPI001EEB5661|nr:TrbI F-type domain-containing protein [Cereibacter azotoformans]ULB12505.1 TrbI F-type domain-containing protein [Cereibacter azotoformans]